MSIFQKNEKKVWGYFSFEPEFRKAKRSDDRWRSYHYTRARARNCISSNSCLKFRFSLNLWRNALSKKRVIRKPSKIHNTYFFLHVVLLLYFKDVLSTQKYCFAIFMYTLGWSLPLKMDIVWIFSVFVSLWFLKMTLPS